MITDKLARQLTQLTYYQAAQDYLRKLTVENHMEATPQATQREITLASLRQVAAERPWVHLYNELLIQYPHPRPRGKRRVGQVCPDNLIVLHDGELEVETSYDVPLQPAAPFMVFEYVSPSNQRKDYETNVVKYEQELRVAYYLLFNPEIQEFILRRHTGERFVTVTPDERGVYSVPEIEVGVSVIDGWVRYWFRGELLPLTGEMRASLREARHSLREKEEALEEAKRQIDKEKEARLAVEAELARLRAQIGGTPT